MTTSRVHHSAGHNVVSFLAHAAARVPGRLALAEGPAENTRTLTFAELWAQVCAVSEGLAARGLKPGERVVIMVPMSPALYVTLLATLKLGAVAVFVDPWMNMRQVAAFAAFAKPVGFIGVPRSHLLRVIEGRLRTLPLTVTTGLRLFSLPARYSLRELLPAAGRAGGNSAIHHAAEEDPALITFTTGSSGEPKGANRTHGFLTAQHHALQQEFPYRDDDVDLSMFPVFALNNIARGIPTIIPQMEFSKVAQLDAASVLAQMRRHRVTTVTASPPFIDRIGEHFTPGSVPLRRILVGGAAISDAQLLRWKAQFPDTEIVLVYGSTEAEPTAHIAADERLTLAAGGGKRGICMGRITPLCRAAVVRISKGPLQISSGLEELLLPGGEIGELIVTGKHVCREYFQNPEAVRQNKVVGPDGEVWHRMGDTGYFDRNGYFWLVGRVHSTIVRDGTMLHAQEIEKLVMQADSRILKAAAVGVPDGARGEKLVIVAHTSVDAPQWADIRAHIARALEDGASQADSILVRSKPLPVDPRHNSKVQYQALLDEISS